MKALLATLAISLLFTPTLHAQDPPLPETEQALWDIYTQPSDPNSTNIIFLNVLSGETHTTNAKAERFTLSKQELIFFDRDSNQVQSLQPQATPRDHPFITLPPDAQRIDWTISNDRHTLAWTITRSHNDGALSTSTYTAQADGSHIREILSDGPRDGLRVLPLAFASDNSALIMDLHPDGIDHALPYRQFAGLFALDLRGGSAQPLSDESPCYCAAGFGNNLILRFPSPNLSITNLNDGQQTRIPGPALDGFTIPGQALLTEDDSQALYALSQAPTLPSPSQDARTIFIHVNLQSLEQSPVSHPIAGLARPISWTEDSSAILFTSDLRPGTWKLRLSDGRITHIANAEYLGQLGP